MKGRPSLLRNVGKLVALTGLCAVIAVACSGGQDLPPGMNGSGGVAGAAGPDSGSCSDGQTRDCHVTLGDHNGVLSCYDGTQTCVGGTWSACGNGTVNNRPGNSGAGGSSSQSQSLSSPTPCQNNPCDPYCQNFNEQPDSGVRIGLDGGSKYNWSGGTLSGLPTGLVNKGLKQPCSTGADCQFNTYCQHPVTSQQCAHSKCQTGTGLDPSCDQCVSDICAVEPSCCNHPYKTSCTHDPCTTGGYLKSNCDSCVSKICSVDPYCCGQWKFCFLWWCWTYGAWDWICKNEIGSVCHKSCPLTINGTWSQSCVDKVNSVCDAKCGTGSPPPEDGTCVPWLPGQTDSSCSGVDLSAGVPCDLTIPVCNHGTKTAPAGVPIVSYPANSKQYPKCNPSPQSAMKTCKTTAPIPPGQCIDVKGCLSSTDNNREIMVNPPNSLGTTGHIAECSCQDNWTLYTKGTTCGPPSCSGASSVATFKPVNLYFIVDKSGSMWGGKWSGTTAALKAFFKDPASAGIGAALEFFPLSSWPWWLYGDGCGWTCSPTPCSHPMVPLGKLTAQPAPADKQEQKLVTALNEVWPGGSTPTYPALDGALTWAKNNQAADPKQQYVVVLVTDGVPTVCDTNIAQIAKLADDAYVNNGIRTYTIAMAGANIGVLDQIAKAGGTGSAFVIKGTNSNQVQQQMVKAFEAIAGQNVSCTFPLPNQGAFDPNSATVTYTSGSGSTSTLPQEQSSSSCGTGWYYDNNASPTTITLCPKTCSLVQADAGAKVAVQLGCPKSYTPVTYTQTYQATCPSGTLPQWGYLAYDTTTPGNSNVVFSVRTAATQSGLSSASYVGAATAQASPNTQVCPLSGPSPCPVDLYSKLGQYSAINQYLELQITLNPTGDGSQTPTVNNWQLTYSCPPAQ